MTAQGSDEHVKDELPLEEGVQRLADGVKGGLTVVEIIRISPQISQASFDEFLRQQAAALSGAGTTGSRPKKKRSSSGTAPKHGAPPLEGAHPSPLLTGWRGKKPS